MYSIELMKQRKENVCARCEKHFPQWSEYHKHAMTVKCIKIIRPINTSGRTKIQIISGWEAQQKEGTIIQ